MSKRRRCAASISACVVARRASSVPEVSSTASRLSDLFVQLRYFPAPYLPFGVVAARPFSAAALHLAAYIRGRRLAWQTRLLPTISARVQRAAGGVLRINHHSSIRPGDRERSRDDVVPNPANGGDGETGRRRKRDPRLAGKSEDSNAYCVAV